MLGVSQRENTTLSNGAYKFQLDFGRVAIEAKESWLETRVRASGSAGPHAVLSPRQKLMSMPYAIFAQHEQWDLAGVPVGFPDRAGFDQAVTSPATDDGVSQVSVAAKPRAESDDSSPWNFMIIVF
jgi:hypothetical protein